MDPCVFILGWSYIMEKKAFFCYFQNKTIEDFIKN